MAQAFSINEALTFGWTTFLKDPWFYASVTFVLTLFPAVVNVAIDVGAWIFALMFSLVASTIVAVAFTRIALTASVGPHAKWHELLILQSISKMSALIILFWFLSFFLKSSAISILFGLPVTNVTGMVFPLLAGHISSWANIIAYEFYSFGYVEAFFLYFLFALVVLPRVFLAPYLLIDKSMNAISSLKESYMLTKGHHVQCALLFLSTAGINICGAILLGVGLLVTIPVTLLTMGHVYRILVAAQEPMVVAPVAPTA